MQEENFLHSQLTVAEDDAQKKRVAIKLANEIPLDVSQVIISRAEAIIQ